MIVLSDIHANLSALESVLEDMTRRYPAERRIALLGDCINYGMRPNEVIGVLKKLAEEYDIVCNLYGNHEKALMDGDTDRFSTERGKRILEYTGMIMTEDSMEYVRGMEKAGFREMEIDGKKCLFVHGGIPDPFWGKLGASAVDSDCYRPYDYVISGHSHVPHLIEHFFEADSPAFRNKKRTVFINPGSVGQPRNHNVRAQYAYVDIGNEVFHFNSVEYDVATEISLYPDSVDSFYKERLSKGI